MKKVMFLLVVLFLFIGSCMPVIRNYNESQDLSEIHIPVLSEQSNPPAETFITPTPQPQHSPVYIHDVLVEDVITYFNEVCLDAEFVNSGDPSNIQKWGSSIPYIVLGSPTEEDRAVLYDFIAWLNGMDGFPGMEETDNQYDAALKIHFCDSDTMICLLGENFYGMDGGVTFWYDCDVIYDEIICIRNDISQTVRNSVILEELYNGLGPVQDTSLRDDSIIYSGYSEPQDLTAMDELILKLLYHPDIKPGMDRAACEAVIRELYY